MIIVAALLAAQAAPPPPLTLAAPPAPSVEQNFRRSGLSEAGIAVVMRKQAEIGPQHERLVAAELQNAVELNSALAAPAPDVARLRLLLQRQDSLRAERAALRTSALVQMLEAVPAADRRILLGLYATAQPAPTELPRPGTIRPGQPK